jgi:nucleotide-binding universal stress UspA family protein
MLAEIRKKLNVMVPPDALANGISTEVSVIEAHDIAKAIRQEGERFGADVICVGAHNHSGLSRLALGSVAQAVTIHSGRPVLVVHRILQ